MDCEVAAFHNFSQLFPAVYVQYIQAAHQNDWYHLYPIAIEHGSLTWFLSETVGRLEEEAEKKQSGFGEKFLNNCQMEEG